MLFTGIKLKLAIILGRFLYNNYRQCIQIICEYIPDVRKLQDELNVSNADMEGWLEAERNFLRNLKEEPDDHVVECMYVQALINMQKAEYVSPCNHGSAYLTIIVW